MWSTAGCRSRDGRRRPWPACGLAKGSTVPKVRESSARTLPPLVSRDPEKLCHAASMRSIQPVDKWDVTSWISVSSTRSGHGFQAAYAAGFIPEPWEQHFRTTACSSSLAIAGTARRLPRGSGCRGTIQYRRAVGGSIQARSGNNERIPFSLAGQMPRSVISPVTRREGVSSKP